MNQIFFSRMHIITCRRSN